MFNWAMMGRFNFFWLSSLRLSLQHLSSLSIFLSQDLGISDEIFESTVEVGRCVFFIRK